MLNKEREECPPQNSLQTGESRIAEQTEAALAGACGRKMMATPLSATVEHGIARFGGRKRNDSFVATWYA
jgi:hypothetical protein